MKSKGHQHGMVRTYRVLPFLRPESQFVQQLDSPMIEGVFTKVPTKPTDHSKFTGRCGKPRCLECRMHPACKSKDKAKGSL
ncbi:putative Calcium-binding site [Hibiscus syriacus]|uniref:Calcium-binding site n=1 Tax=Hibiscus syriacus TaxID=106335 RepID=A0A6A2WD50_HIBSY|nr:putative Calcium-binding site [Hibiscus syriacus]